MTPKPNFFDDIQIYADESNLFFIEDKVGEHPSELIAYDEWNRDFQLDALAGGWQGEVVYPNPDPSEACW